MTLLFDAITHWDNLWQAFRKAVRGKRRTLSAAAFEHQVVDRLLALQAELRSGQYTPSGYRHFIIHEPKRRRISAAAFRDRVVHHALCNVIEPLFDARFISDSYANRKGKGTHAAIDRLQAFSQRYRYVLRMDIVQHFPSLDHALLRAELGTVIDDPQVMQVIDLILQSGEGVLAEAYTPVFFPGDDLFAINRARGLPIGNLTSQFWSNVYMNPFDWFVKRELGCRAYLRYVDDFALFADDKAQLNSWRTAIIDRLARLRLTCHEAEAQVLPCEVGIPWLGSVVYPTHRRLKRRGVIAFTRRLRHYLGQYAEGHITFAELDAGVQGWIAHVNFADTWGLREHLFAQYLIPPRNVPDPRGGAHRRLQA